MVATYITRYGYSDQVDVGTLEDITRDLINELREEKFDEPDEEHTQVSIGNEHWAVTALVSGLIVFDNMDLVEGLPSHLPETMYLRDIPNGDLKSIWKAIVENDEAALMSHQWCSKDKLAPYKEDFYRTF
jgi:hypothetical protein